MYAETRNDWAENQALHGEKMSSLEDRLAVEKPELVEPLRKTRKLVGQEIYERAFKSVETFNMAGDALLIVVSSPRESGVLRYVCR